MKSPNLDFIALAFVYWEAERSLGRLLVLLDVKSGAELLRTMADEV